MKYQNKGRFPKHGEISQKKSLGQVFLNTDWPVKKIVEHIQSLNVKRVIEIGPGNGILTLALANAGIHVTAVEKDDRFAERLQTIMTKDQQQLVDVQNIDVLQFDLKNWIRIGGGARSAVLGNIPYNISTPIVMWALPHLEHLVTFTIMVQLEFAQRIAAQVDTKNYGSLSVFCQLRANCEINFDVGRSCFTPIPKVDSAVISLTHKINSEFSEAQLQYTETVCKVSFTQRRKKLRNGVKPFMGSLTEDQCPVDLNRRAETLTPHEFVRLASFLFQGRLKAPD